MPFFFKKDAFEIYAELEVINLAIYPTFNKLKMTIHHGNT